MKADQMTVHPCQSAACQSVEAIDGPYEQHCETSSVPLEQHSVVEVVVLDEPDTAPVGIAHSLTAADTSARDTADDGSSAGEDAADDDADEAVQPLLDPVLISWQQDCGTDTGLVVVRRNP